MADPSRNARAHLSLEGLSLGNAFGGQFFVAPDKAVQWIASRTLPEGPWRWSADTAMAFSVVEVLGECGVIDRDVLAERFARRWSADPDRGYSGGTMTILREVCRGTPWRNAAERVFGGEGSRGNGAAMRVAPVGAYFADDLDRTFREAVASAAPTHTHPEAHAGAVAVALAAALAWQMGSAAVTRDGQAFLTQVRDLTPDGGTRDGLAQALTIGPDVDAQVAATILGSGERVVASDTVPFSLWCAARHLGDYEEALWTGVAALGDRDTTCAIVGGIVALSAGKDRIPKAWREAREPLP